MTIFAGERDRELHAFVSFFPLNLMVEGSEGLGMRWKHSMFMYVFFEWELHSIACDSLHDPKKLMILRMTIFPRISLIQYAGSSRFVNIPDALSDSASWFGGRRRGLSEAW